MREIKFRAYIKSIKKILPVIDISFGVDGLISDIQVSGCGEEGCRTCNDFYESDDFIIMQYTGLKDVYGKEIYEGDIVYGVSTHEVQFNEYYGGYLPFVNDGGCGCCSELIIERASECEIIGNVFENPEYLKEEE